MNGHQMIKALQALDSAVLDFEVTLCIKAPQVQTKHWDWDNQHFALSVAQDYVGPVWFGEQPWSDSPGLYIENEL